MVITNYPAESGKFKKIMIIGETNPQKSVYSITKISGV